MAKKKSKAKPRARRSVKRVRRYGMVKVRKGQKLCWMSVENKHGWSLGLALNDRTIWLKNVRLANAEEVHRVTDGMNVVYVEKKGE